MAAWLPQFYERQLGVKPGVGEAWVGLVAFGRRARRAARRPGRRPVGPEDAGRPPGPARHLPVRRPVDLQRRLPAQADHPGRRAAGAGAWPRPTPTSSTPRSTASRPRAPPTPRIDDAKEAAKDADEDADDVGREPLGYDSTIFLLSWPFQVVGFGIVAMSIPGLRAGLTDAVPAHLRGTGFGAFNLAAVVFGQAAAPFVVGGLSAAFDENLRTALLARHAGLAPRRAWCSSGPASSSTRT